MKKALLTAILTLLLVPAATLAADFWEKKDFSTWDDKEVIRLLTRSPWARQVTLSMDLSAADVAGRGGRGGRGGGGGGGGRRGGGGFGGGIGRGGGMTRSFKVTVRWYSALPVRQAIARYRFGDEVTTAPGAVEMLSVEQTHYIVGVEGRLGRMLRDAEGMDAVKERVKSESFLKIKKQDPILPDVVDIQRGEQSITVYVVFPRGEDGGHVITLEDKDVEFVTKLGRMQIKRKFKLKDMVYGGRLEL